VGENCSGGNLNFRGTGDMSIMDDMKLMKRIRIWLRETPLERRIRRRVETAHRKHGHDAALTELLFQAFLHRCELERIDGERNSKI